MFYNSFYFFQCKISKVPRLIAMKFCTVLGSMFSFIMPVQKIWGLPQKIFGVQ